MHPVPERPGRGRGLTLSGRAGIWPSLMENSRTVRRGEPGYPGLLERVPSPPSALRLRGTLGPPGMRRVAVVGSRGTDPYGADLAHDIAGGLAGAGVSVVSGGAEGVDAAAHRGALEAGGHTVAVMGCGFAHCYPAGHRALFEEVVARGGALVTEHDDPEPPAPWTFPRRNRIVAGLSELVVVVRAAARSGALNTAAWARRAGIPVCAVPGDVRHPLSAGPTSLLRAGASPVASAADVLEAMGLPAPARPEPGTTPELHGDEAALWRALGPEPQEAGALAREAGLAPGAALAGLLALELEGLCQQLPGQLFLRRSQGRG